MGNCEKYDGSSGNCTRAPFTGPRKSEVSPFDDGDHLL